MNNKYITHIRRTVKVTACLVAILAFAFVIGCKKDDMNKVRMMMPLRIIKTISLRLYPDVRLSSQISRDDLHGDDSSSANLRLALDTMRLHELAVQDTAKMILEYVVPEIVGTDTLKFMLEEDAVQRLNDGNASVTYHCVVEHGYISPSIIWRLTYAQISCGWLVIKRSDGRVLCKSR